MIFSWGMVRALGNSWPSKISIAIPLTGNLLLLDRSINPWTQVGSIGCEFNIGPLCLFSTSSIYNSFLALCLIGVASAIYQLFCPSVIKKYTDEQNFMESQNEFATRSQLASYLEIISQKKHRRAIQANSTNTELRSAFSGRPGSNFGRLARILQSHEYATCSPAVSLPCTLRSGTGASSCAHRKRNLEGTNSRIGL